MFKAAARADRQSMQYRLRHAIALHGAGRIGECVSLSERVVRYKDTPSEVVGMIGHLWLKIAQDFSKAGDAQEAARFERRARAAYAEARDRAKRLR